MENRDITPGEVKETAQSEVKPDKEKKPDAKPIDGARVRNDVAEVLSKLDYLQRDVQEDVVKDFRAKLDAIRQKFQKLDETKVDALRELEKEMYKEFSPFLKKAAQSQLSKCKNIQKVTFEKRGMNFTFGGQTMSAELTDLYEIRSVQILGATVRFQKPVQLKDFDNRMGNNLLASLQLIAKRFDPKGMEILATELWYEFTAKDDGKERQFVATPQDVLEVTQVPTAEKVQEWRNALKDLNAIQKRMEETERSMREAFKDTDVMIKMQINGTSGIDVSKFTPEQKKIWDAFQALRKEFGVAAEKERSLRRECGTRMLKTKDGTQVREESDPEWKFSFQWVYLNKDGKEQTRLSWSGFRYRGKTEYEYEKGEPVRQTYFSETGQPEYMRDFRSGTSDIYDKKGKKSYRELFDLEKPDIRIGTQMYDAEGRLMDERALQAMTPAQIEAFFLPLLAQEDFRAQRVAIDACYTAAKYIIKCPRGEEIMRRVVLSSTLVAFEEFTKYKDAPYAVKLLEEAAYQIEDKEVVTRMVNDATKVPGLSEGDKKRIIAMAGRKKVNTPLAEKLLSIDQQPQRARLLEDPGLRDWSEVKEEWIDWRKLKSPASGEKQAAVWKLQMRAMIARNLYFQNLEVNEANVKKEFLRIVETREKYSTLKVFKGRNVLHAAHTELIRDVKKLDGKLFTDEQYQEWEKASEDPHRFGKKGTQDAIKKQQDGEGTYEMLRPAKNLEALQKAKEDILQKIKTMGPPSTFIFDGHGGPDAWYLSDGTVSGTAKAGTVNETDTTVKISVEELAQALVERAKKFPQLRTNDPSKKDIFIFACCYNTNFIRSLYMQMGDAPKPIALGASEYGQYGYSKLGSIHGSRFFSEILQLEKNKKTHINPVSPSRKQLIIHEAAKRPTVISDVFENEFSDDSNPSLYIPDDKNLPMQITRDDGDHGNRDNTQGA